MRTGELQSRSGLSRLNRSLSRRVELLSVDMVMKRAARVPARSPADHDAQIVLTNSGNKYEAMVHNMSATGALVEGL